MSLIEVETLDLEQAALLCKAEISTIRAKAHRGEIPGRKVGKRWVFVKAHLLEWISGRYEPQKVIQFPEVTPMMPQPDSLPRRVKPGKRPLGLQEEYYLMLGRKRNGDKVSNG